MVRPFPLADTKAANLLVEREPRCLTVRVVSFGSFHSGPKNSKQVPSHATTNLQKCDESDESDQRLSSFARPSRRSTRANSSRQDFSRFGRFSRICV